MGTTIGGLKGDTRGLDYSSCKPLSRQTLSPEHCALQSPPSISVKPG